MSWRSEKKEGRINGFSIGEGREKFTTFICGAHMEQIMKSGLSEKGRTRTTDIKADTCILEQALHVE